MIELLLSYQLNCQLTLVGELVAEPHAEFSRGQDAEALLQGDVGLDLVVEVVRHVGGVVSREHAPWGQTAVFTLGARWTVFMSYFLP